jgi:hypothetical protein
MKVNLFWNRIFGIFGILGGLTLFAGDMLFYYDPFNINLTENMGNVSDFRIIASGVSALLSNWLYLLGLVHVNYALKPTIPIAKNTILLCFGAILTAYGVVHGAYVAIATSAKLAVQNNLDLNQAVSLASEVNTMLRVFVYPIFGLLSLVFITQVWKKKTLYPRWILLFFPLLPFVFQQPICERLSGDIWIVICGGYLNLILMLFFTGSTIALWNPRKSE